MKFSVLYLWYMGSVPLNRAIWRRSYAPYEGAYCTPEPHAKGLQTLWNDLFERDASVDM